MKYAQKFDSRHVMNVVVNQSRCLANTVKNGIIGTANNQLWESRVVIAVLVVQVQVFRENVNNNADGSAFFILKILRL